MIPNSNKADVGLALPASNADAERGFSMLRKIHTDSRPRLAQSTIVSLMAVKMNIDKCCLDVELSSELLKSCKQATRHTMNNSQHFTHTFLVFFEKKDTLMTCFGFQCYICIFFVCLNNILFVNFNLSLFLQPQSWHVW